MLRPVALSFLVLGVFSGCSDARDAELERTKAELAQAQAEATKAKAEAAEAESESSRLKSEIDAAKAEDNSQSNSPPSEAAAKAPRPWAEVTYATLRLTADKNQHEKLPVDLWEREEWDSFNKRKDAAILATIQGKPGMFEFVEKSQVASTGRVEGTDDFDTLALSIILVRDFDTFWFDDDEELIEKRITGLTFPNKYSHFAYDFVLNGKQTKEKKLEGTLSGTFRDLGPGPSTPRQMFIFSNLNFKDVPFTITQN